MEANSAVENEHLKVEIKMTFLDKCDEDFFNAKFYQFQKESVIHFLSEFQSHFFKNRKCAFETILQHSAL